MFKQSILAVLISIRFQFVVLAVDCVLLGVALRRHYAGELQWVDVLVALLGGVCAHAAVDLLNDWSDGRSGLDEHTERTPFSGGSGALQRYPEQGRALLMAGIGLLGVTVLCGVWFVLQGRWGVIPLGGLGVLIIVVYTPWITRHPLVCLLAPGLAFGPMMVAGTVYALGGSVTGPVLLLSLIPFFLVNNLLLLNQFPDAKADEATGRKTLPIWLGYRRSAGVLGLFYAAALTAALLGFAVGWLSVLAAVVFAVPMGMVVRAAYKFSGANADLLPALKLNVLVVLLLPLLLSVVLLVG